MRRLTNSFFIAGAMAALAAGCGDDGRMGTDTGTGDTGTGDTGTGDTGTGDTGTGDTGMPGDGNDDFAEAEALEVNASEPTMAAIQAPGDSDYYSFTATAGQWIVVSTTANPEDDTEMIDTVIQLFDASMTMVAENDDSQPRTNTDSELIYHVPADGTYYVRVLEFTEWAMETPLEGDPTYTYAINVFEVNGDAAAFTIDAEGGDDLASAQDLGVSDMRVFLMGTFDDADDVDVYSFSVADDRFLDLNMMPTGAMGYGSTAPVGGIWITTADGSEIVARLDNTDGDYDDFGPALPAGEYRLWIEHGTDTAGANDFYVVKGFDLGDNPAEAEEGTNGDVGGSEALEQTPDEAAGIDRAFFLAQLPDGDVDYFSFDATDAAVVSAFCTSMSSGSGVQGLHVELRDAADAVVGMDDEDAVDGALIEEAAIATPGTHHIRLSQTGQDAEVTGTFVRCGIAIGAPAATP